MDELEKNKKFDEQQLGGKELYELKRKQKEESKKQEQRKEALNEAPKKIGKYFLYTVIGLGVIGGIGWFISTRPSLPPTLDQGHTEDMPQTHITDIPIPDSMQRHMLEHADGRGKPGVIIQYNCQKYSCEPDLIEKLANLVKKYPDNVYLAPNTYDGKIILTKLGKRQILDAFDEQAMKEFIE
ncbi:MAG: hypothetical protein AAB868_02690 [Patescibacteria group bacterium]